MKLSSNQRRFISSYARTLGVNPAVAVAQLIAEEPAGANVPVGHSDQNWLNIGNTDSKWYAGAWAGKSPEQAGRLSALWTMGKYSVPGFGRAAPGIVAYSRTAGKSVQQQIQALQKSGWASSGYPNLPQLVQQAKSVPLALGSDYTNTVPVVPAAQKSSLAAGVDTHAAILAALMSRSTDPASGRLPTKGLLERVQDQIATGAYTTSSTTQRPAARAQRAPAPSATMRGRVIVSSGANRSGVGLKPVTLRAVDLISAAIGHPLTVGTGTNHNQYTTTGNVSDHWDGHAADIPATGAALTKLGQTALQAFGQPSNTKGGAFTFDWHGHRVQIIFNSTVGGNHYNHLHVGIR